MITLMYVLIGMSLLFELLLILGIRFKKNATTIIAGLSAMTVTFASGSLFVLRPNLATAVLVILSLIRVINPLRFVENRMHYQELLSRSRRTFVILSGLTALLVFYDAIFNDSYAISIFVLLYAQLLLALLLFVSVYIARHIYRYRLDKKKLESLPTVSVCIPARNETADLPACIESVLASTYPKLEIIVLDDCSHDKTPEVIKKYAHDGVRFVNGKEPRDDWVAKNAAYDRLADEARGEVLMFIGVDVRIDPNTITELMTQFDGNDMLSVLPKRSKESESAFFIQPIRYWWEMGLWRFVVSSPPVLSTCWLIRAKSLKKLGTFESVKKAVEPEAVFARTLHQQKRYAFLVANDTIGLTSNKIPRDQFVTAMRKRYSQLRRRPEALLGFLLLETVGLLLPWLFTVYAITVDASNILTLAVMTIVLQSLANAEVYKLALRKLWPFGLISMPLLLLADCVLMIRSMYAYEFGKVIWKERNICLPLLTVEKSLPKID